MIPLLTEMKGRPFYYNFAEKENGGGTIGNSVLSDGVDRFLTW